MREPWPTVEASLPSWRWSPMACVCARSRRPGRRAQRPVGPGKLDTAEKMRHYYVLMGPLYALNYDAAAAEQGRALGIHSPEAMAQAFAPGGFLQTFDFRPELSRITAPTLILADQQDWICPPEFSEEIHPLNSGSRLQVLANSSHSLRVDAPEVMRAAIAEFVSGASQTG